MKPHYILFLFVVFLAACQSQQTPPEAPQAPVEEVPSGDAVPIDGSTAEDDLDTTTVDIEAKNAKKSLDSW